MACGVGVRERGSRWFWCVGRPAVAESGWCGSVWPPLHAVLILRGCSARGAGRWSLWRTALCVGILLGSPAFAAEVLPGSSSPVPLTLAAAERVLMHVNPGVLRAQRVRDALAHDAVAVRQLPDPQLDLMAQNAPLPTLSLAQGEDAMLSVGITQQFPPFGKRSAEGRVLRTESESALYGMLATEAQRLLALRVAWNDAMYDQAALAVLQRQQALARLTVQAADAQFRAGRGTEADLLRAQLDRGSLDNQVTQVRAAAEAARAAIAALLALPDLPALASGWPKMPPPPTLAEIDGRLSGNPLLREAEATQRAAQARMAVARSAYYPKVAIAGSYGKSVYPGMPDTVTLGITLSLPIFTADRQDQGLEAARARAAAARYARMQQVLQLRRTLRTQFAQYVSVRAQLLKTNQVLLPTARAAFAAALASYGPGQTPMNTLLKTQRAVLRYALEETSLRRQQGTAAANLDYLATQVDTRS